MPHSDRSRRSISSVDGAGCFPFQNVRSQRECAAGSNRPRGLADLDSYGTMRATGTESRVTMISPAVASFLSASGHLSRISRTVIRTMGVA